MRKLLVMLALAGLLQPVQAQQAELGPTLRKVAESGTLYLAHREDAVPFSYVLADRETPAGYAWDICGRVVKAIEARIGKPVRVVPVVTTANSRALSVKSEMADIECGASANTTARQKQVDFSVTFHVAEVRIMARNDAGIRSIADLAGKRLVSVAGSPADRLVKLVSLARNVSVSQVTEPNPRAAQKLLDDGKVEAFAGEDAILVARRALVQESERYVLLPDSLAVEPYGLMLPKGDVALKALVDGVLVDMMKSGEMAALYDKWFMQPIPLFARPLNLPLTDLNKATFAYPNDRPAN